ncbi:DNA-processing protein DprA [Candidatus Saccharibacteria bacterium]|nr:DNA-processing protein DprA [Candidatus Saccharibacteria bacterium]
MSTLFSHFSSKINRIAPLETKFTEVLDAIALKPKTLYFYGKIPENMSKTVAIVGSRHNTKYGEEVAYKLAYELAKHDVIVISGLAYGIDSVAHRGCLDAGGKTIAVLGTPINRIYPRAHESLAREIIEKDGAIFSEYGPDETCYPNTNAFLRRNRIISGLSDIVVVVEAAEKSGSLNTATHALNQGKDVFAVPGNINNPYSRGCNNLIKQGAFPYTEPDDLMKLLFPEEYLKKRKKFRQKNLIGDTEVETLILQALARGLRSGEEIMKETHLPPEVFNEVATILEIKSRIRALGMNNWSLV